MAFLIISHHLKQQSISYVCIMKVRLFSFLILAGSMLCLFSCKNSTDQSSDNEALSANTTVKTLSEKLKNDPKNASLYFQRGQALKKISKDSLALVDFKKAIAIDSSKAEYFSAIGDLMFEHKDVEGSIKWFQKALQLDPKDKTAHLKMAKLFVYVKDYPSAFTEINTVLRQDVYNPEGYFLKGMIYKDLKDTSHAISSFQTAVQVNPKYKDAIIQLGLMYSGKKDPMALKYFDNAWKLDTIDVFPLFAKGVYYQNQQEYELAKEQYKNAILHDRQYIDAYLNTGYVLMQQDSFEKAWRQYDLLTKIDQANPEAYYNRGLASEMMGKKDDAIADYKQALIFDKSYANAHAALDRIGVK